MANKLGLIAVVGLTVSVISLASAAVIGSYELGDKAFNFSDLNFSDKPRCRFDRTAETATREMIWEGNDHAVFKLPAQVHYRPGTNERLVVSGNADLLTHIRFQDGALVLDCNLRSGSDGLKITLPGRAFKSFAIHGAGRLTLDDINQKELSIFMPGASEVEASGKADDVKVSIVGAGEARMERLVARKMDVSITGAGDAEISPQEAAKVSIIGAGSVRLATEPKTLETHIIGAGEIERPRQ